MQSYIYKYKKEYSYLLLSGYLFLVGLSVFHYHHINLENGNYKVESSQQGNSEIPIDKLLGLDNECIVTHFASTISNISYVPKIVSGIDNNEVYISFENPDKLPHIKLSKNNLLRAPPSILFL
jgi:hypothetical protein